LLDLAKILAGFVKPFADIRTHFAHFLCRIAQSRFLTIGSPTSLFQHLHSTQTLIASPASFFSATTSIHQSPDRFVRKVSYPIF